MSVSRFVFRWLPRGLAVASLFAAAAAAGQSGEVALDVPSGEVDATAGEAVELQVVKRRDGAAVAGERVEWALEDPASGRIEGLDAVTRAGADGVEAGSARARFVPARSGRHGITVSTPVDPACEGGDCRLLRERVVVLAAQPLAGGDGARTLLIAGGTAAAIALAASGGSDDGDRPQDGLAIVSGNNQAALGHNPLGAPLVVAAGSGGGPAAGAAIDWTASAGVQLSSSRTFVSAGGQSSIDVISVGPGPGTISITACLDTAARPCVTFTATVDVAGLVKVSGDNQNIPVGTTSAAPLVVRTTLNGNPQAGVAVTWQVFGAGGLTGVTAVSNGSGLAQAFVDASAFPGPITVQVTRADAPAASQSFTLNAIETRDLVQVSGDGQSAAQGSPVPAPLVVRATDNGAGDPGVTILWSATGGAVLSATSTVTDPGGFSQVSVTDIGMGVNPVTVFASRADVPSLSVSFQLDVDPPSMVLVSGDGQSGLAGTQAPAPIVVQLLDGNGVGMSGQMVQWMVVSGSAILDAPVSMTDTGGFAEVGFTFGANTGPITIEASAFFGAATVSANATSTAPGAITIVSGDGQIGQPTDSLAPLVVSIGTPTAGVPITFTVTQGQATVSPSSTTTDTNGNASTVVTLGTRPGPVVVNASGPGNVDIDFHLTIDGDVITSGTNIVSGDGQDLVIGTPSAPMVIELIDVTTNLPIQGVTVDWHTTNGTMVDGAQTVTDTNGRTSNRVEISAAGAAVVTASFPTANQYDGSQVVFQHNGPLAAVPNLAVNEASVAEALDAACGALGGGGALTPAQQDLLQQCTALAAASGVDPGAVGEALSAMLPDVAQTQADAGKAAVGAQFENLNGRIVQLRSGMPIAKVSFNGLNLAMAGGQMPLSTLGSLLMDTDPAAEAAEAGEGFSRWAFFVSGNIGRGESDPTSLTPRYDFDVAGLTAGVDYRWSDRLVLGVALGYTSQDTDLANAQGSVDTRGFSLSGYTTWYVSGDWYLDGVLTFARNNYDHERRIQYVLPGVVVDQRAVASSDGHDLSATVTFGRDWHVRSWQVGAWARAQYNRLSFDAFEERVNASLPGAGLALRVESREITGTSAILGGRVAYAHSASWGVLIPQLEVEWQNDFQSDAEAFRGYFIDDPTGTPILVIGDDLDSNYFRVGLGMSMVLTNGRSGFINYERVVGRSGISQEMLSLGFRWEF